PYKHFADKEELLAAVAARELRRHHESHRRARAGHSAVDVVKTLLRGYVRHALRHPEPFRLTYGPWRVGSAELGAAADSAPSARRGGRSAVWGICARRPSPTRPGCSRSATATSCTGRCAVIRLASQPSCSTVARAADARPAIAASSTRRDIGSSCSTNGVAGE